MGVERKTIEAEGNTVEEAISSALEQLGADRSQVEIEVLEEENKGFFRRAGKARVRVSVAQSAIESTVALVEGIMKHSNLDGDVEVQTSEDGVKINITGPDLGLLIGKRGDTLSAIQTIANVVARKAGVEKKIIVDVENYRDRRAESLTDMAHQAADRAVRTGRTVALKPMNSYDRRLVHVALQDNDRVYTMSEGEEPDRQVIVAPKK